MGSLLASAAGVVGALAFLAGAAVAIPAGRNPDAVQGAHAIGGVVGAAGNIALDALMLAGHKLFTSIAG